MPRWDGVRGNNTVTMFSCDLNQITDEHIEPMAQQLADGVILVIATRRQAVDGTPLWLRVWRLGRWIYLAAFDAPNAEKATAYAWSGPSEKAKRAPDRWSLEALQGAAQTANTATAHPERPRPRGAGEWGRRAARRNRALRPGGGRAATCCGGTLS